MRILLAYHFFPHYRLPVMRKMLLDKNVQYTFLAGQVFDASIKTIGPQDFQNELFQWKSVKNIRCYM